MANSNGWGDGAANNTIGWGQGATNAIGWGSVYAVSSAGRTDIIGATGTAPSNIDPPVINNDTFYYENSVISFTGNVWGGNPVPTLTYQWLRNNAVIVGATNTTYTTVFEDVETLISVKCTATNSQGTAFVTSNQVQIYPE